MVWGLYITMCMGLDWDFSLRGKWGSWDEGFGFWWVRSFSYSLSISPSYFPLYLMGLGNWSVDPGELSFSLSDWGYYCSLFNVLWFGGYVLLCVWVWTGISPWEENGDPEMKDLGSGLICAGLLWGGGIEMCIFLGGGVDFVVGGREFGFYISWG